MILSFDRTSLYSLIDGDTDLFRSLLDLYSEDWPQLMTRLRQAYGAGDSSTLEQVGHRLKGNLRNFYAKELSDLALRIEEAGRDNDLKNIPGFLDRLEKDLKNLESQLLDYYNELRSQKTSI